MQKEFVKRMNAIRNYCKRNTSNENVKESSSSEKQPQNRVNIKKYKLEKN